MIVSCKKCNDTGWYMYDHNHSTICDICCKHDKGWFNVSEHQHGYIPDSDNACCLAGCGVMRRDIVKGKDLTLEAAIIQ